MSASARTTPFRARPYDYAEARRIADELDLAEPVAIALVRRGHRTVEAAREFLAAAETHDPGLFEGIGAAIERIGAALDAGTRITVHGDYDVDGICATAIMVGALRRAGGECDWLIPDRLGDGYGLSAGTVEQLRERGTGLLVTVDCGIGSALEVAAIEAAGIEVVVTDHHQPGPELPACPIVHPLVGGYPFDGLCGAAVAAKLAQALEWERGGDGAAPIRDLDLVALATVADLVPLVGENRSLVRRGLESIRRSPRPGLLALMAAGRVEAERVDEGDIAFRLGPRLNAAGRLYRADAGVELMLTGDDARAAAIAAELDAANHERRETERRVTAEAEAALRGLPAEVRSAPLIVVAGEGWHPGVVGIVAARLAERHEVPAVVLSIGEEGRAKGSGRSIEGFDLLAALDACADHLDRYGGHRAAAGLELDVAAIDGFRAAMIAHAETVEPATEPPEGELVDAFVGVESLGLDVAEQLATLAPFGRGNPGIRLIVPGARVGDVRPMGEEGKHARFNLSTGSLSARAVAFNANGVLSAAEREPHDLAVRLEVNHWNGAVEPRAVLADAFARGPEADPGAPHGHRCREGPDELWWSRFEAALAADPQAGPLGAARVRDGGEQRQALDARRGSATARIAELLSSGERVMVVTADGGRRSALALPGTIAGAEAPACACLRCPDDELTRLGADPDCDLLVADWGSLVAAPHAAAGFPHLVLVDPPSHPDQERFALTAGGVGFVHRCWGASAELAELCWDAEWDLHGALADIYRSLAAGELAVEPLRAALVGVARYGRTPEAAARSVRVLRELGIVAGCDDGDARSLRVVSSERTKLELSEAYRAYAAIHQEGLKYLQSRRAEP
ncbi:MAG TPA: single-stranded-DNA-specific exonuclease RecJ [Solirubrobacterales bacterium]|nr:single-stranded-DNA-specific exonuclease RecJ [Solirubrobacterales bacterium]